MKKERTLIQRIGHHWHPLARLNFLISSFFLLFEIISALSLLLLPGTIDNSMVDVLFTLGLVWWCGIIFCIFWVTINALWLTWSIYSRRRSAPISWQNIIVGWSAPVIFVIMMTSWIPLVETVTDYRLNQEFQSARPEMLEICDSVLVEGNNSEAIRNYDTLGDFKNVNVILRQNEVYFERRDILRTFGYVCVAEGKTQPARDAIFEYEKIDDRFYYFAEIENDLTPEPEATPTVTPVGVPR